MVAMWFRAFAMAHEELWLSTLSVITNDLADIQTNDLAFTKPSF